MTKNSEKRNILFIHQHFCPPGGFGNNRSYEIAKALVQSGHSVTILAGSGNFGKQPDAFFSTQILDGIRVDVIRITYAHKMTYLKRIISFILFALSCCCRVFHYKKSIDLIYASSTPLSIGVVGIWYKYILKKPLFFETVDIWPDVPVHMNILKNKHLISILYWMEKKIYETSDYIIALSDGMKEYIQHKGISSDKISVLYNGTNIQTFFPQVEKAFLRASHHISSSDFIVLYAGTIGLANGLEFFIQTAAHLQTAQHNHIKFYLIGDGNRLQAVKLYAKQINATNVVFIESMPKNSVSEYFQFADIGIVSFAPFPILTTNSANKFYDYLASGLPVLINYEGWQKKVLEQHDCGFAANDPLVAANIIIKLSQQPKLCKEMSEKARALAEDQYDRIKIAAQLHLLILQHS